MSNTALRTRWVRRFGVLLAGAVAVVACSGNDDTAVTSPTATVADTTTTSPQATSTTVVDTPPPSSPLDSSSVPSSSELPVDPGDPDTTEGSIVAAYLAFWDARFAVLSGDVVDPDDARLAAHATGAQLDQVRADAVRFRDEGWRLTVAASPAEFRDVEVISVDDGTATVQECVVDDLVVVDSAGGVVNDLVITRNASATLLWLDGVWKVERATSVQSWEGVAGCALAD